ncbi:MAG TPA: tetratricopeptide repeat protein [Vicinamibacterales bacterium]|nr:tetratricopeptide repeat protein [Vicinamibacterales bacterium]
MDLIRGSHVIAVAGLCVWGIPGAAFAQTQVQDAYYNFLLGRHLSGEGDQAAALTALERAASLDPKSAEVRAEIASVQIQKNPQQAEQTAKAALALDPDNAVANRILGLLYAEASRNAKGDAKVARARDALPYLERTVNSSPTDINMAYRLGQMYLEAGDAPKAIGAFSRVVDLSPDSAQAREALATAQASIKDYKGAIQTLQPIAEDEPSVLPLIGGYQQQAGLLTDAIATYTKALESEPKNATLKATRILAMIDAKQYQNAITFAADARRQHPDDRRFPWLQSRALFRSGSSSQAIEILESTVKAYPRDFGLQLELADYYNDSGRGADAEKLLRQLIDNDPSNADALNYLGYLFARNGRNLDEAISLVNRALKLEPNSGAYLDSLGWAYFKRGDLTQAEKYLKDAATALPENGEILDHLGDLHARQGRWQDAIDAWSQALKGSTSDIDPAVIQKKIDDARSKVSGSR